jgi:L-seryl-tRNA(Ser) seleniumtransferase
MPNQELLAKIPAVDLLLRSAEVQAVAQGVPRRTVVEAVRAAVDQVRAALLAGRGCGVPTADSVHGEVVALAVEKIRELAGPHYRRVINATGIILHTGLGRAVLPAKAVGQIVEQLSGYSLLQADIETGARSRRDARIQWLLGQLTGAEAATVVNNNAAATAIVLNTLAAGKEVIVSRGQLVEIGGSFRLPDVMASAGARLVEVGTTNKTHLRDYERAITEHTAAILRVHPSNYKILGFTAEVPLEDLVKLGQARGIPVIDDVGAGSLVDFSRFGFAKEPTLPESIAAGADLVTCSADKLIGGPQGGLILGRTPLVDQVRKNPLARIVRVDKVTLAALEATLSLFLEESTALEQVPTLKMLGRTLADLDAQARRIADSLGTLASLATTVVDGSSQMGSGSLPTQELPTRLVAIQSHTLTPSHLAARLRRATPPVFARVHEDQVLLDPRTLLDGEEQLLVSAICAVVDS